ncbi:condensation domain-containing protein [Dyella flagellata]|uniref:condensation domain-containing protein n=1 Tax=Dyella flagellata TaxID=1867833 RepID=UPI0024E0AA16|nr:condensation domain-containing protein [Dyella flagellata]
MVTRSLQQFYQAYAGLSSAKRRLFEQLLLEEGIDENQLCILPRSRTTEGYPVSSAQARVFFFEELHPSSAVYNLPSIVRTRSPLDAECLRQALQRVATRHEVFRLGFELVRGQITQKLHQEVFVALDECRLGEHSSESREAALQDVVFDYALRPFDLRRPPLLRVLLIHTDNGEQYVLFVIHHIVADGLSIRILVREVGMHYQSLVSASGWEPAPLPIQYIDYAIWERERATRTSREGLDHWLAQLGTEWPRLRLPTDFPRPAQRSHRGKVHRFMLDETLVTELRNSAREEGVTLFVMLLAGYALLLAGLSGIWNIPVAVPMSGRHRAELEELIGFFGNTVICYARLAQTWTLRQLVAEIQRGMLAAHAGQDVPFEEIVRAYGGAHASRNGSMYDTMFEYLDFRTQQYDLLGLDEQQWELPESLDFEVEVHTQTAKCDLFLCCWELGPRLECIIEYDRDLFEAGRIAGWSEAYVGLLRGMTRNLDQPMVSLTGRLVEEANVRPQLSGLFDEFNYAAVDAGGHV